MKQTTEIRHETLAHERLDAYRLALELHTLAMELVPPRGCRVLRDQLERASLGIVLNLAEGSGRSPGNDRLRFYEIARGSAAEVAAALDVLRVRRIGEPQAVRTARGFAVRLVQMLVRLAPPRTS